MHDPSDGSSPRTSRFIWVERVVLAVWVVSILFCVQFAWASGDELEPQASLLGWVLVAILLVGGLATWRGAISDRRRG